MQRILHATMDGVHLYKFVGMRIDDISKLRFNGRPIDIDFLPQTFGSYDRFLRFDEPLATLTRVVENSRYHLERNERPNPFAFELPASFASSEEREAFAEEHGVVEHDHDGDVSSDQLVGFYTIVADTSTEERDVPFEIREIGEIVPCPEVGFTWEPIQPHDAGVPPEMWHIGPVQVTAKVVQLLFWRWVEMVKDDLCIKSMYPHQKGAHVYFSTPGSNKVSSIAVDEMPEFMALLGPVQGINLDDLIGKMGDRMSSLQALMMASSPIHTCPRCDGAGALPCPRCLGEGMTDTGQQAQQALRQALDKVRFLKGNRDKDATEDAMAAVRRLERFILPEVTG